MATIEYWDTFPTNQIKALIESGYTVKVNYCGTNMASPYRIAFYVSNGVKKE